MLAKFFTDDKDLSLLQSSWARELNPVLANPIVNGHIVTAALVSGSNQISHKLGRRLTGYIIVKADAPITVYELTSPNVSPDLTLLLNSSAAANVSIYVF